MSACTCKPRDADQAAMLAAFQRAFVETRLRLGVPGEAAPASCGCSPGAGGGGCNCRRGGRSEAPPVPPGSPREVGEALRGALADALRGAAIDESAREVARERVREGLPGAARRVLDADRRWRRAGQGRPAGATPGFLAGALARARAEIHASGQGRRGAPPPAAVPDEGSTDPDVPEVDPPVEAPPTTIDAGANPTNCYRYLDWFDSAEWVACGGGPLGGPTALPDMTIAEAVAMLRGPELTNRAAEIEPLALSSVPFTPMSELRRVGPWAWRSVESTPCEPRYTGEGFHTFCACIDPAITPGVARYILADHYGADWEEELWAPITEQFTGKDVSPGRVDGMLEGWEGAKVAGYGWDLFGAVTGYTAGGTTPPRQKLMQVAIRLVCGFYEGVPDEWDNWTELRESIVSPLANGEMRFRIYGPSTNWAEEVAVAAALVAALLEFSVGEVLAAILVLVGEHGITELLEALLDGEEVASGEATTEIVSILEALEAAIIQATVPGTQCHDCQPLAFSTVTGMAAPTGDELGCSTSAQALIDYSAGYDFDGVLLPEWGIAANHAVFTRRVWFCSALVDLHAMALDWQISLAYAHAAQAVRDDAAGMHHAACRNRKAALLGIRRGAGIAASFNMTLIHEVSHNVDLYHCWDPSPMVNRAVGGLQDVAAYSWYLYTAAKCGFGLCDIGGVSGQPTTVRLRVSWELPPRAADSGAAGITVAGWATVYADEPRGDATDYVEGDTRLVWGDLQYRDGGHVDTSGSADAAGFWTTAAAIASLVAGRVDLAIIVGTLGSWIARNFEHSVLIGGGSDDDDAPEDEREVSHNDGVVTFTLSQPLRLGGEVWTCCVSIPAEECRAALTDSDGVTTNSEERACWRDTVPDDTQGCCDYGQSGGGRGIDPPTRPDGFGPWMDPFPPIEKPGIPDEIVLG